MEEYCFYCFGEFVLKMQCNRLITDDGMLERDYNGEKLEDIQKGMATRMQEEEMQIMEDEKK